MLHFLAFMFSYYIVPLWYLVCVGIFIFTISQHNKGSGRNILYLLPTRSFTHFLLCYASFLAFMIWHYIVLGLGFQLGPSGFWSQVFINCDESECKWYSLIIVSKSKAPTCISKWLKGFYFFRRFGEAYCELFKKYVASRQRSLWESKDITDRNSIYG